MERIDRNGSKSVIYQNATTRLSETVWALLLIITGIAIFVPLDPIMPRSGLDPSWMMGMNEAIAHKMAFGREIVFTFGPYAPVYTKMFHPQTFGLACFGGLVVALPWSVAMWVLFRQSRLWLRMLAIVTVVVMTSHPGNIPNPDAHFFSYVMLAVFALYVLVKERAKTSKLALIVAVLFIPFGLLPIIKGSLLIACVIVTFFSMGILAVGGYATVLLIASLVPFISVMIFWTISGQSLADLPAYLSSMLPIIEGYSSAMSVYGRSFVLELYLLAALATAGVLAFSERRMLRPMTLLVLTLVLVCFLVFKAAFVRHDGHATIAGGFIALMGVITATLVSEKSRYAVLLAALTSWGAVNGTTDHSTPLSMTRHVISVYYNTAAGFITSLTDPALRMAAYKGQMSLLRDDGRIGALDGTSDIYSYNQWALISSGNAWAPRPVPQSYSAYTPDLAYLNRDHLLGPDRPDNLIFEVQPIDGRLPSLEDGASWPAILANYTPEAILPAGLKLLFKGQEKLSTAPIRKISDGMYGLNQLIPIPVAEGPIFVEIGMDRTFAGTLENTLFKTGLVDIQAILMDGSERKFRYIPEMGRSGFVLSPFIDETSDFTLLFGDPTFSAGKRVKSFRIAPREDSSVWYPQISVAFYKLAVKQNPKAIGLAGFNVPLPEAPTRAAHSAKPCAGHVDYVGGVPIANGEFLVNGSFTAKGWLISAPEAGRILDRIDLILQSDNGSRFVIPTKRQKRRDVAIHFQNPTLVDAGFTARADLSALKDDFQLQFTYQLGGETIECSEPKIRIKVR